MSAIGIWPITAVATMYCRNCGARWESAVFEPIKWRDEETACAPAFAAGWRVFVGGRGQLAYCPSHSPSRAMRQLLPKPQNTGENDD